MASKNASDSAPVSSRIALARLSLVNGPLAIITLVQSSGGRPLTSSLRISMSGSASRAAVTVAEKTSRSTASASPAGTIAGFADDMTKEPAARNSQ